MKLNDIQPKHIVLVSGSLASGKGHFIQSHYGDYTPIEVSSVVKELSGFKTRSQLGTTKDLDTAIAERLIEKIQEIPNNKVVVDGIRQITILKRLEQYFGNQIDDIIWLDAPEHVRRQRFEQRAHGKDDMTFDKSIESDRKLGIGDVEQYIRANHKVVPYE